MSIHNSKIGRPFVAHFSSANRISGTNNDFVSNPINLPSNEYDSISVVQTSIPRSTYNVPYGYNTFTLDENGTEYTITLPPGNYTKSNLQTAITTQLNAMGSYTYTTSYPLASSPDTFHYTFSVSGNSGVQPKFIFGLFLYKQLGFNKNSTHTFTGNTLESVNCIDLSFINRVFIKSNITAENEGLLESVLSYGSNPTLSFAYHYNQQVDIISRKFENNSKNSWSFSLVDEDDLLVGLNGVPFHFTIVFYKRNDTHEIQKDHTSLLMEEKMFDIKKEINELEKDNVEEPTLELVKETGPLGGLTEDSFEKYETTFSYPQDYIDNVIEYGNVDGYPINFGEDIIPEEEEEEEEPEEEKEEI